MLNSSLRNTLATFCALAAVCSHGNAQGRSPAKEVRKPPLAWETQTVDPGTWPASPPGHLPPFPDQVAIWGLQRTPASGPARIYGKTTSGCIAGAVALPIRGEGYIRRRPWRRTGFGHPELIEYVRRIGEASRGAGLGALLIGDMSLPRGGAYVQGHSSHQTGLDVDIAFKTLAGGPEEHAVGAGALSSGPTAISPRNAGRIEALLRLAAADERVDRIFVGAKIKKHLCQAAEGDRRFLDVLRPWLGHERHFHVRLKCPADSPECRSNEPVSAIPDDCQALSGWWESAQVPVAFADWRASERATYARALPEACRLLPISTEIVQLRAAGAEGVNHGASPRTDRR